MLPLTIPFTSRDRAGNDPIKIDASPGNVVFMRVPGFLGTNHALANLRKIRPFHLITDIQTQRYTFALRQNGNQTL
jgi:hypothetical protein